MVITIDIYRNKISNHTMFTFNELENKHFFITLKIPI